MGGNFSAKLNTAFKPNVWNIKFYRNLSIYNLKSFYLYFGRNPNFVWNNDHDIAMCQEVLVEEPYRFKMRSTERGQAWESIAENLNAMPSLKFRVTARSVRDRYNLLTKRMQAKLKMEEKSTGIDVETSELDVLLEEILEKDKAAKEKMESDDGNKRKIVENDKTAAEDMRKQALERMGQTAKRKKGGDDSEAPKKKSRRSTADAVEYLKERAAKEIALKEQELELRKKEQENMMEREKGKNQQQENLISTVLQQQQQQQQMMMAMINQQQQQSQSLLTFMEKFVPK